MNIQMLLPLVEQAVINGVISHKAPFMKKNKLGLCLVALSGFFLLAALGFGISTTHMWLLTVTTPLEATAITAAGLLTTGLLIMLAGFFLLKKKPVSTQNNDPLEWLESFKDMLSDDIHESISENPKTAVTLAAIAGFIAANYTR